jgi:hypothetical protein
VMCRSDVRREYRLRCRRSDVRRGYRLRTVAR